MKKFRLQLEGWRKCYFLIFSFFIFPNIKWLSSKILWRNCFFYNGFFYNGLWTLGSSLSHKYYWSAYHWQWNDGSLNFFKNIHGNAFVSLFFLNKRNITASLLMIHLKCTGVHYGNLNSSLFLSPIFKPYLKSVKKTISFFLISYLCWF